MRAMRNTGPNPLRHVSILLAGILVTVAPLHIARADAAGEREQLARVIHELQALEPLLRQWHSFTQRGLAIKHVQLTIEI